MRRQDLHEDWTLRLGRSGPGVPDGIAGGAVPARVPGCVHTDLLSAGLLSDPDVGTAAEDQHWVGSSQWVYTTTFSWHDDGADNVDLICAGLDTVAEIRLNGRLVGRTRNMHRGYRFPVRAVLREEANELEVTFDSVYELTDAVRMEVGELPSPAPGPQGYIRKMGCNFGTDWLPPLVTAGIWRPIGLEHWSGGRLIGVRPLVEIGDGTARVTVHADVAGEDTLRLRATLDSVSAIGTAVGGHARCDVEVQRPRWWWPVGMGEAHTYPLTVDLLLGDEVVDSWHHDIGLRRVEVREELDREGRRWALHVNGRRVPVRGFNWTPDDPFPTEVGQERYERRIAQAVGANANLLRVWGGATYESETFYETCDRLGLLVWQDFMFSCAAYPETPEFSAEVEAEAREVVTRLSAHPSVVIWNGNNECIWGFHDWGWQQVLRGRPWGALYYLAVLPRVLAELDPTRPYLPGSPWSGALDIAPNDPAVGVSHLWDEWNRLDYRHYRDHAPAFVAEMGWCGPPSWSTLRRAVPSGELLPTNPVVDYHLRAEDGVAKLSHGVADHFPPVETAADWHFLAQVVQARALTVGVDHLRGLQRCSGAVVWQLHDCWPVISWSMIDDDERPKPAWYAMRAAFSPRRCTAQPDGDYLAVVLVNDEPQQWDARVRVRRVDLEGSVLGEDVLELICPPVATCRSRLASALAVPGDARNEALVLDVDGSRTTWFWAEDSDLAYPPAAFDVSSIVVDGGLLVTVAARSFLRDLSLFPDRLLRDGRPLDKLAVVDDLLVTLLAGEWHAFFVPGADETHRAAVARPPVLRCVNDIAALARGR